MWMKAEARVFWVKVSSSPIWYLVAVWINPVSFLRNNAELVSPCLLGFLFHLFAYLLVSLTACYSLEISNSSSNQAWPCLASELTKDWPDVAAWWNFHFFWGCTLICSNPRKYRQNLFWKCCLNPFSRYWHKSRCRTGGTIIKGKRCCAGSIT